MSWFHTKENLATETQIKDFNNSSIKKKNDNINKYGTSGIKKYVTDCINDTIFNEYNNQLYAKKLPFVCPNTGRVIPVSYKRFQNIQKHAREYLHIVQFYVHVFMTEKDSDEIYLTAKKRAAAKAVEHSSGDNTHEVERIRSGIAGEFAFQKHTKLKVVDDSISYNSAQYDVPDVSDLNIGIKSSREENLTIVAQQQLNEDQLIAFYLDKSFCEDVVVLMGMVSKEVFADIRYQRPDLITANGLLAKSVVWNKKTAYVFGYQNYKPLLSINDISDNQYSSKNFILDKDIDFTNPSQQLINSLSEIRKEYQSSILYVDLETFKIPNHNELYKYLSSNDIAINNFKTIVADLGFGVVFIDKSRTPKSKDAIYFPHPAYDKYCFETISQNGTIIANNPYRA